MNHWHWGVRATRTPLFSSGHSSALCRARQAACAIVEYRNGHRRRVVRTGEQGVRMSIGARLGALGALFAALALGLAACQTSGTVTAIATDEPGPGPASWLAKPEGDGPFPAVVLIHGCSGTERNTAHQTVWRGLNRHAGLLNANGYVTLIVDSFGPRRITDGCQTGGRYYPLQLGDAYAALRSPGVAAVRRRGSYRSRGPLPGWRHGNSCRRTWLRQSLAGVQRSRCVLSLLRPHLPLRPPAPDPHRRRGRLDPGIALPGSRPARPRPCRAGCLSRCPPLLRSAHAGALLR